MTANTRAGAGRHYKLWLDGAWQPSKTAVHLRSPFSGEPVAHVDQAMADQMRAAIASASSAFTAFRKTSRYLRSALLKAMAEQLSERRAEFVKAIVEEAGKPLALADLEVTRALTTFTVAAEEAKRYGGDVIPIDIEATARAYGPAVSYWAPRGPVLGITPFNFPLNLVAHKVAPALAVGAPIIIKPAPQAPGGAVLLAEVFEQAAKSVSDSRESVPLAALQVLSASNEVTALAIADKSIPTVSFTGSTKAGWTIQQMAVGKRVLLELGGNAAVIVHSDADLMRAANRCAAGGFGYAGQSCISVQRVFVQRSVAERFEELLLAETAKIKSGDPQSKEITNGPMIDKAASDRVLLWIEEAKRDGAKLLTGGNRHGTVVEPTVLRDVKSTMRISSEEVFAPLVTLSTYDKFSEAIEEVNNSRFGLQAGVFTDSSKLIQEAIANLDVGGILINEIPTYRADQMPYGGVKESGLGREGLRYAMEEYSERKTVIHWMG